MRTLKIFRPGAHTDSTGKRVTLTEADLKKSAQAYSPATHEAPIVVGHPANDAPAFGWIGKLAFADGHLSAEPRQVNADFAELVKTGSYKKISASFYMPDSPTNPVPGSYYLRHVGFLGAMPPALKGLPPVNFKEEEVGIVTFNENDDSIVARFFRNLRDFFIAEKGQETADKILPSYDLEALTTSAVQEALEAKQEVSPTPVHDTQTMFNEGKQAMDKAEAEAAKKKEEDEKRLTAEKDAAFAEREAEIVRRETELAKKERSDFLEGLISEGKILPAAKPALIEIMGAMKADTVSFSEGTKTVKKPALEVFQSFLSGLPKSVTFGEAAGSDKGTPETDPELVGKKARAYVNEQEQKGNAVSFTEAVRLVSEGKEGK
ncbi:MAG: peptidase [Nitrospinae bacterium]|nr:peptidase [Nitrospinota bacterium]